MKIFVLKLQLVGPFQSSPFSGIQNDALMHREGLKGYYEQPSITIPKVI